MKSLLKSRKQGQVGNLAPAIIALIFAGIVLVMGLVISQEMADTQYTLSSNCNKTSGVFDGCPSYNFGNKTVYGLGTFADFWEIIVLAIVITVVIGLLLVIFGGRQRR